MQSAISQFHSRFSPPTIKSTVFGLLASVAVFSAAPSAFAGTKEIAALQKKLPVNVSFSATTTARAATVQELVDAYKGAVEDPLNKKLSAGIIAGELLRLSTADVGNALATAVLAEIAATKITLTKNAVASSAVLTAAGGKAPKVDNLPAFTSVIAPSKDDTRTLALLVKKSLNGQAAVFQGYAATGLSGDVAKQTYAKELLTDALFLKNSKAITAAIVNTTTGTGDAFATAVLPSIGVKTAEQVLIGVVVSRPLEAGAIVKTADSYVLKPAGKKPVVLLLSSRGAAIAASVGAIADIEQVQKVGEAIAGSTGFKLAQASGVAAVLARQIVLKRFSSTQIFGNDVSGVTPTENRNDNKIDELGELAAYMLNKLVLTADFQKVVGTGATATAALANKAVFGLITSIVSAAKFKVKGLQTPGPLLKTVLDYVTGSVALTLQSIKNAGGSTAAEVAASTYVLNQLQDATKVKALAKLAGDATVTTAVYAAMVTASLSQSTKYEDGTVALTTGIGAVVSLTDPETNTKNF